jgi:hypothetical protein
VPAAPDSFRAWWGRQELSYGTLPVCPRRNCSKTASMTRTALEMRMWGNSPRSQSRYTVARHTPSRSATSRTVSSRSGSLDPGGGGGVGRSSKIAAKSLGSWRTGWDGWTVPGEETRVIAKGCEPLVTSGRPSRFLGVQVVAGSNPVAPTIEGPGVPVSKPVTPGPSPFWPSSPLRLRRNGKA